MPYIVPKSNKIQSPAKTNALKKELEYVQSKEADRKSTVDSPSQQKQPLKMTPRHISRPCK